MSARAHEGRLALRAALACAGLCVSAAPLALRFTPQASGVRARLRGVSAVSARVAWASGAQGTVLVTGDGGRTWRERPVPAAAALDFRDVDAFSERVAYLLSIGPGEASRIYKTTDGGARWQEQFRNRDPKAFLDAMAFWDERRGLAVSDSVDGRFVVLLTRDGGRNWTAAPAGGLPPALPNEGAFAASGTNVAVFGGERAWFATTAGRVLRTTDAGRTWTVASTGLATGESAGIFSVAFRDARHGVVVGGDYKQEALVSHNCAYTDDGGVSWRPPAQGLSGFRSVVTSRAQGPAWLAFGPLGADVSQDDGRSWSRLEAPGCHAFSFAPDGSAGFCVGEDGRIARLEPADGN